MIYFICLRCPRQCVNKAPKSLIHVVVPQITSHIYCWFGGEKRAQHSTLFICETNTSIIKFFSRSRWRVQHMVFMCDSASSTTFSMSSSLFTHVLAFFVPIWKTMKKKTLVNFMSRSLTMGAMMVFYGIFVALLNVLASCGSFDGKTWNYTRRVTWLGRRMNLLLLSKWCIKFNYYRERLQLE